MNTPNHSYVFLSVFYQRASWHLLLYKLRSILLHGELNQGRISNFWIFLNQYRGTGVRVMLECAPEKEKETIESLVLSLQRFTNEFPSAAATLSLPVTSYFADYPNNTIKFNCFDKTMILHESFSRLQGIVSRILLHFFEEHQIDDEGVFTFVMYLQYATVSTLTTNPDAQYKFYGKIIAAMSRNPAFKSSLKHEEIADPYDDLDLEIFNELPEDLLRIIIEFKECIKQSCLENISSLRLYFRVMSVLQLHMFEISDQVFFDSADLMYNKLKSQTTNLVAII